MNYIRDNIALRFEPFKRMYENDSKITLHLCYFDVSEVAELLQSHLDFLNFPRFALNLNGFITTQPPQRQEV